MEFQWYPGHMTKARRMMEENSRLVDLMIELLDARIPLASRNPDIDTIAGGKARLVLLNKADLADEACTKAWISYFEQKGCFVVALDSRGRGGMKEIDKKVAQACQKKIERDRSRGILNRPVRAMVAGIPNVGKSTFINSFAKKAVAKTGNKPGVTRGKQWIRLSKTLELLDTPGILWPKFEDPETGLHLALIGSMNDEILDTRELAVKLAAFLLSAYPKALTERYGIGTDEKTDANAAPDTDSALDADPAGDTELAPDADGVGSEQEALAVLSQIAERRGCLKKGQEPDLDKAAGILLEDFRSGRLGRISLERAPVC